MKTLSHAFRIFCLIAAIRGGAFAQDESVLTPIDDIWSAVSFATMVVEAEAISDGEIVQKDTPEFRINSVRLKDITSLKGGDVEPDFRCSSISLQGIPNSWLMRDALSTWAKISTSYSRNRVPYGGSFLLAPRATATKGLFFIRKWNDESRIFFTISAGTDIEEYKQVTRLVLAIRTAQSKRDSKPLLKVVSPEAPDWVLKEAVSAVVKSSAYRTSEARSLIFQLQTLPEKSSFRLRSTAIGVALDEIENNKAGQVGAALFVATLIDTPTPLSDTTANKLLSYSRVLQSQNGNRWNEARRLLRTAIMNGLEVQNGKVKAILNNSVNLLKQ